MVRAAAKNHAFVGVIVDPADYDAVLAELREKGWPERRHPAPPGPRRLRRHRGLRRAVVAWFDAGASARPRRGSARARRGRAAAHPGPHPRREQLLRYGENPHQIGARYSFRGPARLVGRARCGTAARRCPTSTCTTPRRRGGWCTRSVTGRPRSSSSTPTRAAWRWPTTSPPPTSRAHECDPVSAPSAASWP